MSYLSDNPGYKHNFETIRAAVRNGGDMIMECIDNGTGKPVIVLCARYIDDEGMIVIVPLAKLFDGNPYEQLTPPSAREVV